MRVAFGGQDIRLRLFECRKLRLDASDLAGFVAGSFLRPQPDLDQPVLKKSTLAMSNAW
jgi:hypothetical protein